MGIDAYVRKRKKVKADRAGLAAHARLVSIYGGYGPMPQSVTVLPRPDTDEPSTTEDRSNLEKVQDHVPTEDFSAAEQGDSTNGN